MLQFITFYLGGERYAVDILLSREIARIHESTPVPESPAHIIGLMNLRGQILTLLDPQVFLEQASKVSLEERSLIILKTEAERLNQNRGDGFSIKDPLAIVVDEMGDILRVNPKEILPPPPNLAGIKKKLVSGVIPLERRLVVILNINELVSWAVNASRDLR
ncbi:MAG: purine-binding chemotaxis protein CheW [Gammaproteobacteria bacterium]|nr:purine-binding chemotaxis protein CheW [Gammaproteobacteria bacterium]